MYTCKKKMQLLIQQSKYAPIKNVHPSYPEDSQSLQSFFFFLPKNMKYTHQPLSRAGPSWSTKHWSGVIWLARFHWSLSQRVRTRKSWKKRKALLCWELCLCQNKVRIYMAGFNLKGWTQEVVTIRSQTEVTFVYMAASLQPPNLSRSWDHFRELIENKFMILHMIIHTIRVVQQSEGTPEAEILNAVLTKRVFLSIGASHYTLYLQR